MFSTNLRGRRFDSSQCGASRSHGRHASRSTSAPLLDLPLRFLFWILLIPPPPLKEANKGLFSSGPGQKQNPEPDPNSPPFFNPLLRSLEFDSLG